MQSARLIGRWAQPPEVGLGELEINGKARLLSLKGLEPQYQLLGGKGVSPVLMPELFCVFTNPLLVRICRTVFKVSG